MKTLKAIRKLVRDTLHQFVRLFTFLLALFVVLLNTAIALIGLIAIGAGAWSLVPEVNWVEVGKVVLCTALVVGIMASLVSNGWALNRLFRSRLSNPKADGTPLVRRTVQPVVES